MSRAAGPITLCSPWCASHLTGVALADVHDLIRSGAARTERVNGKIYVVMEDINAPGNTDAGGTPGR